MARGLFAAILLLMAGASVAQDLKITIKPMFEGFEPYAGQTSLVALVENPGADAEGAITVRTEMAELIVPVRLPAGSQQSIPLHIPYMTPGMNIALNTNRGSKTVQYVPQSSPNQFGTVLMVTDRPGELAIIRGSRNAKNSSSSVGDAYALPEDASDRMVAYDPFIGVVLGSGSERMSDAAVSALKRWLLKGGRIALIGGAGSQVIRDPRWEKLMPAQIGGVRNQYVPEVDGMGTVSIAKPYSGSSKYGKQNGLAWTKYYGAGAFTVLLFDPTESPYREAGIARASLLTGAKFGGRGGFTPGGPTTSGLGRVDRSRTFSEPLDGPFTLKLPPPHLVGFILIGYLIAVIPINFGILKLIKKGEWAWFTVPAISIVFAGVLFNSAQSLYKFGQRTANSGVLSHVSGESESIFEGYTSIFFPKGGAYAPKFAGLELATAGNFYDSSPLKVVDTGLQLEIPSISATNLSYRQFHYTQTLRDIPMPTAVWQRDRIIVKNNTDTELRDVAFTFDEYTAPIKGISIKPGATATVPVPKLDPLRTQSSFVRCRINIDAVGPKFANDSDVSSSVLLHLYPEVVR